jgi:type IV secretion system protein TrbJ
MRDLVIPRGGRARDDQNRAPGGAPRPAVTAPTRFRRRVVPVALLTALAFVATPLDTQGQLPVIDAANLVQNTLTALKTIESVINEVQMIANQVRQLETMVQNTKGLGRGLWDTDAQPRLLRLGAVIDQEQAIAYTMANVDSLFRQRYPGYRPLTDWSSEYELWTRTTLDTLRGTLNSVRLHGEDFATEESRIQALQALSESAEGRMQALQVGNMMAAEELQQLVQLRQLVMAQINAQNVYMAAQTNREAQRAATESEWIRNGNAEAPPLEGAPPGVRRGVLPGR